MGARNIEQNSTVCFILSLLKIRVIAHNKICIAVQDCCVLTTKLDKYHQNKITGADKSDSITKKNCMNLNPGDVLEKWVVHRIKVMVLANKIKT